MKEPIVSVVIATYNHQDLLAQSIDSVLSQKTDYPYEIIIHDDASKDTTVDVIRNYAQKYPDVIIPILQVENQCSKGLKIMPTFLFPAARGKYIAICEGDDYWTDLNKLQKQIDFLEANSDYAASAHQSLIVTERSQRLFNENVPADIHLSDLLETRIFHTASFIFRTELIRKYPPTPVNMHSYDRLLFMLIASNGPIRYFDDVMCVYRKHESGLSARGKYKTIAKDFNVVPYLIENIPNFPKNKYLAFLHRICFIYPRDKMPLRLVLKHYFSFIYYSFSYFPNNLWPIIKNTGRMFYRLILGSEKEKI